MPDVVTGLDVAPIEGDFVDGVRIVRVWTTGKLELADGSQLHRRDVIFLAGSDRAGARYVRKENA